MVVAVTLAAAGLVASVWRPTAPVLPGGGLPAVATFDAQLLATIADHRAPRLVLVPVVTALWVLVPVVLARWGRSRDLVARWTADRGRAALRAGAVAATVGVVTWLTTLPVVAWLGLVHEGRWGFRTATPGAWSRDQLLTASGRWLLLGLGAVVILGSRSRWPRTWPYRLTVAATLAAAVLVVVHPVLIQPLFLRTTPLPDGPTRTDVEQVLAAAGLTDVPVVVADASRRTTRVNALVTGLGPTERVVLYDTLLELPSEQVTAVLAHELAHHDHADVARGTLLSAAAALAATLVLRRVLDGPSGRRHHRRDPYDPRSVLVVVATAAVLELVGTPIGGAVSRRVEAAADARALELGADPAALVRTVRTFVVRDLAAPDPGPIVQLVYGTHPSPEQRLRAAAAAARRRGVELPDLATLTREERAVRHPRAAAPEPSP